MVPWKQKLMIETLHYIFVYTEARRVFVLKDKFHPGGQDQGFSTSNYLTWKHNSARNNTKRIDSGIGAYAVETKNWGVIERKKYMLGTGFFHHHPRVVLNLCS